MVTLLAEIKGSYEKILAGIEQLRSIGLEVNQHDASYTEGGKDEK